jgi:hypothetical protein
MSNYSRFDKKTQNNLNYMKNYMNMTLAAAKYSQTRKLHILKTIVERQASAPSVSPVSNALYAIRVQAIVWNFFQGKIPFGGNPELRRELIRIQNSTVNVSGLTFTAEEVEILEEYKASVDYAKTGDVDNAHLSFSNADARFGIYRYERWLASQ